MKNYIPGLVIGILLSASLPAANHTDGEKSIQRGSTLMGCLKESGMGGCVLSDGTGDGAMVLSKDGDLKKHVGHWVKLDGESIIAGGIEHFRVRTATHMAVTCETGLSDSAKSTAKAELKNPEGKTVGTATLRQAPHVVLIEVNLTEIAPGRHALHVHEKGSCEAPDFKSAGGHFNPFDAKHGFLTGESHHAGDMPNFEAPESGKGAVERMNSMVKIAEGRANSLLGGEGTTLVIHSGTDDYKSQPSGDAGERIACGVIEVAK
jgi:Cu-Zn family superoxide dismutase